MPEAKEINITNSEWIIMEYLWEKAPKTVTEISREMEVVTGWAKSTTKTLISRMEIKGYLRYEEGSRAREYYPVIDRSQVVLAETESFLERLFNGSLGMMVNTLVDENNLSKKEIKELREILDRIEGVK